MFRQISLSLELLLDTSKRSYLDTKLETDRKRREKYSELDKKRKAMIDVRDPFFLPLLNVC
jgi:DnaJ family protein C protein 17